MSDDLRLDSYRRAVEAFLDYALQLRWDLARATDQAVALETMEKIRSLAQHANEQRAAVGIRQPRS